MDINTELEAIANDGLLRRLRTLPASGGKFMLAGREILNFSSNDYLNLSNSPVLKKAASEAIVKYGCGATASRLMSGHLQLHAELEENLAQLTGGEAALVFGSGFLTNLGVITTIAGRNDEIFADRLNHASLIDGIRLSGAKHHRYHHKDISHLQELLKMSKSQGQKIIISDSIFSMDGDLAPVAELAEIARQYQAMLIIDDAHALGIMGSRGGGICQDLTSVARPNIVIGTLSKALGSYGGFAVCSEEMKTLFINRARSFIYSTALPPASAGAAIAAVNYLKENPGLGATLLEKAEQFRKHLTAAGFDIPELQSQIMCINVGDNRKSLALAEILWERGILATAIRPPTVPVGTARLRLSVTLAHEEQDLESAAKIIADAVQEAGVI
ncbi:MAG: 8-amino-7-oxononanoate synthase [Planctomycetes bacterium]|nr:8-amino-7-oxononanoate synthase [Planctomycetota bacterium]